MNTEMFNEKVVCLCSLISTKPPLMSLIDTLSKQLDYNNAKYDVREERAYTLSYVINEFFGDEVDTFVTTMFCFMVTGALYASTQKLSSEMNVLFPDLKLQRSYGARKELEYQQISMETLMNQKLMEQFIRWEKQGCQDIDNGNGHPMVANALSYISSFKRILGTGIKLPAQAIEIEQRQQRVEWKDTVETTVKDQVTAITETC